MILKRFIILFIILFSAYGCSKLKGPEKPKDLISKDKMVDILIDTKLITSANSKNKVVMRDSNLNANTYVFEKHKIDSLQFALSNDYYAFHIEEYEEIYNKLADSLEALKVYLKENEAEKWKAKTKREADSLAKVYKDQKQDSLQLKEVLEVDSIKMDDALLEESIKELEGLLEPISDNIPQ